MLELEEIRRKLLGLRSRVGTALLLDGSARVAGALFGSVGLSFLLDRIFKLEVAARALEMALRAEPDANPELRATASLQQGNLLAELDLPEAAEHVYRELMAAAPGSSQAQIAEQRLKLLGLAEQSCAQGGPLQPASDAAC